MDLPVSNLRMSREYIVKKEELVEIFKRKTFHSLHDGNV
jgi:hypothetical protein